MQIHVVTAGQTLWSIGAQYGVAPGLLARFNGLTEPYRLSVGESLLILKPAQLYTVQPGGLFHLADVFARTERAVPAQPGAIGAGAAVSGTGIGDKTGRYAQL